MKLYLGIHYWPQLESVRIFLKITLASMTSYLVMLLVQVHEKYMKNDNRSSWSRFEHCSKSIIWPLVSLIWSLFAQIHRKNWPKSKIDCSESFVWPIGSYISSLFALIYMTSWPKVNEIKFIICQYLALLSPAASKARDGIYWNAPRPSVRPSVCPSRLVFAL